MFRKIWFVSACMWRWGRSSTSQIVSWWCWHQSTRGSARQGPKSRSLEAVTSAAFPATASPGARRSWWGLERHADGHVWTLYEWKYVICMNEQCNVCAVTGGGGRTHQIWAVSTSLRGISKTISVKQSTFFFSLQFNLTKQEPAPPPPTMGSGILEAGGDFDPPESPPSRDLFPDYIVTVIVPLILAIILCLLLAYVMFCRREGVYAYIYSIYIYIDLWCPCDKGSVGQITKHFSLLTFVEFYAANAMDSTLGKKEKFLLSVDWPFKKMIDPHKRWQGFLFFYRQKRNARTNQ